MCSVVGYIGTNKSSSFVLEGLSRLEYRGYDSVGFAWLAADGGAIKHVKAVDGLSYLNDKFITFDSISKEGFLGIGHSRWATHGRPSESNAHPHFDCTQSIAIVHNGIIENYLELKKELALEGHSFCSDTDTEIATHLLESLLESQVKSQGAQHAALKDVVVAFVRRLEGAYAFMVMMKEHPDTLLVIRKRSPLCIGIGEQEMFVASDAFAFAGKTKQVVYLPDETFALIYKDQVRLYNFSGHALPVPVESLDLNWSDGDKQG
jgi:glucosamine--fructose-6-phosphate aminotransferase (isomerizing)